LDANREAVASHPDAGPIWLALIEGETVEYDDLDALGESDVDAIEQALRADGWRLDGAGGFGWRAVPQEEE
jgi:hypothetical protein